MRAFKFWYMGVFSDISIHLTHIDDFKNAVKIVRTDVFTSFKKTLISTIFRLTDENIKKVQNFNFFAEK